MSDATRYLASARIFDGVALHADRAIRVTGDGMAVLVDRAAVPSGVQVQEFGNRILSPGYVDVQVNGGGGVMFNDAPNVDTIARIARAHRSLGTTQILPTLITDTPATTTAAIAATIQAVSDGVPGVVGLHLEGPHLSVARKGAHDPAFIRPMSADDLAELCAAAARLPVLKVTLAPENVTLAQVQQLAEAGVLVSLGHTDATFETCIAYAQAGARCATHLFNAMSQMGNRAPGLVGAALHHGGLHAGLIADGIHVHPATMKAAWQAKTGPARIFLVSDAMAVAGTDLDSFTLGGRRIVRKDAQLTLDDGTLAGADLDLTRAVSVCVEQVGLPLEAALAAATSVPAALIGRVAALSDKGMPAADLIQIDLDAGTARPVLD